MGALVGLLVGEVVGVLQSVHAGSLSWVKIFVVAKIPPASSIAQAAIRPIFWELFGFLGFVVGVEMDVTDGFSGVRGVDNSDIVSGCGVGDGCAAIVSSGSVGDIGFKGVDDSVGFDVSAGSKDVDCSTGSKGADGSVGFGVGGVAGAAGLDGKGVGFV